MGTGRIAHAFVHRHSQKNLQRFDGRHGLNQQSAFVANQIRHLVLAFDHDETAATIATVGNDWMFFKVEIRQFLCSRRENRWAETVQGNSPPSHKDGLRRRRNRSVLTQYPHSLFISIGDSLFLRIIGGIAVRE